MRQIVKQIGIQGDIRGKRGVVDTWDVIRGERKWNDVRDMRVFGGSV
jgi:hypothetical protein